MTAPVVAALIGQLTAPATSGACLRGGVVDAPFPIVAALVGLLTLGVLVYFARRVGD